MGLLSAVLGLPLAPVQGTIWIAEQLMAQAEQELTDPEVIRAQLEEVDRLRQEGSLTDDEADAVEDELMQRLVHHARAGQSEL